MSEAQFVVEIFYWCKITNESPGGNTVRGYTILHKLFSRYNSSSKRCWELVSLLTSSLSLLLLCAVAVNPSRNIWQCADTISRSFLCSLSTPNSSSLYSLCCHFSDDGNFRSFVDIFFLIVMHAFVCALVGNVHLTFCICATVSGSCSVFFSSLPFLNKNKGRTHIDIGIIDGKPRMELL